MDELKANFKMDDHYITEDSVMSHFIYEFVSKKKESNMINFTEYDLETYNIKRAGPYKKSFRR